MNNKIYFIIMGIAIFSLIFAGVSFVYGVKNAPLSCPVPDEVRRCDCTYNSLGDKNLRYCFCYPGDKFIDWKENLGEEVLNGTIRNP